MTCGPIGPSNKRFQQARHTARLHWGREGAQLKRQCVRWTRTPFRLLKLRHVLASVRGACARAYLGGAVLGIPAKSVGAFDKSHAPDGAPREMRGCDGGAGRV